jgi:hypothetical protein
MSNKACLADKYSETDGVGFFDRERILVTNFWYDYCSSFGLVLVLVAKNTG